MSESVLVVGYDYDEFRELQDAGAANRIVCDRADSPAELVRLAQAKRYNCIFCDISVLDSVPYIHAIRKIQVTPIIIGAIEECKNISIFSRYTNITDQAAAAPRLAPVKAGNLRLYPVIIKYPFWQMTAKNQNAIYACINQGQAFTPPEIASKAICINQDEKIALDQLSVPIDAAHHCVEP